MTSYEMVGWCSARC